MKKTAGILDSEAVQNVLAREYKRALGDSEKLAEVRDLLDAARAAGKSANHIYPKNAYLCIEAAMGRFLYLAAKSIGAMHIVEFGTSYGISTLYLAAAASETGGRVISTELEAEKAIRAKVNLEQAGLAKHVEIRQGDALETLQNLKGPVDLIFLDGWKDLYVPVLDMMQPLLRPGALILADNIFTFPEDLAPYVDKVSRTSTAYKSAIVPFESGLAYSVYHAAEQASEKRPVLDTGALCGIARKAKRRAPVETLDKIAVTIEEGLEGDNRGRFRDRAVTVLEKEAWQAVLDELDLPADVPWTLRRANLLTHGVHLPHAPGGVLRIGDIILEVTGETNPCSRMEEQQAGLFNALGSAWRGGVTCRVLKEGTISEGDPVQVLISPPKRKKPSLPG